MSDEAQRSAGPPVDAAPRPVPETLSFGPVSPTQRSRRLLVAGIAALLVLVGGVGIWRLLPAPAPPFSLADLQGVYSGMVRSDGTNEVSTVTRDRLTEEPVTVDPTECTPLFEATLSNQFPAAALDGVSTYWLSEASATISLATFRYGDDDAARRQFDAMAAALAACDGRDLRLDDRSPMTAVPQDVPAVADVDGSLSFAVSAPGADNRFTTDVALLDNTVTWQYRYDFTPAAFYRPDGAQQLMGSMVRQLHAVQDAHR